MRARAADQESLDGIDTTLGDWAYADADGSVPVAAEPQQDQHLPMTDVAGQGDS